MGPLFEGLNLGIFNKPLVIFQAIGIKALLFINVVAS